MRYTVLAFLCLAAVIAYVQRSAMSVPAARMQTELSLTPAEMGQVLSAFYLGYALLQIPGGWFADRFGSRVALILFCSIWSILTGMVSLASGFTSLLLLWFSVGLAQAGIFPAAGKAIGAWFPPQSKASAASLLALSQLGGNALALWLTAELLPDLGWRGVFVAYAVPGFVWVAAFGLIVPHREQVEPTARVPVPWGRLFGSGSMWLLFAQQFCRGAAMAFFFTWFPTFLQQAGGLSETDAGRLSAWPGLGAMLGTLLGGIASDWLLRVTGRPRLARQGLAVIGMTGCSALTVATLFAGDVYLLVGLFTAGVALGAFGGVNGYAVTIEFGGSRVGLVFALMNMGGNIGATIFPYFIGLAIQQTHNWNYAIYTFAGLFAVDAVLWAILNPKRPLFEDRR